MKTAQVVSGMVLILVGAVFAVNSLKLGLGGINTPGPGLVPFGAACLLILFSIGVIVESLLAKKMAPLSGFFKWQKWKPLVFVLAPLFIYAYIMETLGFIPATFFIMLLLFKISEKHSWKVSVFFSVITIILTYLAFGYFMKVEFPGGFFFG